MKRIILFAGMAALVSGCASIKYFDNALGLLYYLWHTKEASVK